jgi:hypothetical protein
MRARAGEQFQHLAARKLHGVAILGFVVVEAAGTETQLYVVTVDVHLNEFERLTKDYLLDPEPLCRPDFYVHGKYPCRIEPV